MKISIEESDRYNETEIIIKCSYIDETLEKLISTIRLYNSTISGKKDNKVYFLKPDDVLYFDTVDDRVFIYTSDNVYETDFKLYELEEKFIGTSIIRISKSVILNLLKVDYVSPLVNGRIEAVLQNGERVIISRQFVPAFKTKLGF